MRLPAISPGVVFISEVILRGIFRPILLSALLVLALGLTAWAETAKPRVLVMGDSLMAWNGTRGAAVSDALGKMLGVTVKDHAVAGARYFYVLPLTGAAGLRIRAQFRGGPWDYVVMNGGGNDLLLGCGCGACKRMMNRLIRTDGRAGAIPDLVNDIRASGAKVIYTGYLRTPGVTSPVEVCGPLGDEMDARLARMAAATDGVIFMPLSGLVTKDGDTSYHAMDLVHPSVKGSRAIAARIAAYIRD